MAGIGAALAASFAVALACVTAAYGVAYLRQRRFDLIDSVWGLAFVAMAWYHYIAHPSPGALHTLLVGMVTLWGLRLSWHILPRWLRAQQEDPRYSELRRRWPTGFQGVQTYVRIYVLQAVLVAVVSLPVAIGLHSYRGGEWPVSWWTAAGVVVWAVGFGLEAVADRQLRQYVRRTPGGLLTSGLWRYSRHPNYFGELVLWCGVALLVLPVPYGWLGLVGTLTIGVLLLFVSGVPPAERRAARRPGWEAYKRGTSVFVPWPPKTI